MSVTEEHLDPFTQWESALRDRHRSRIRNFALDRVEDEVDLYGLATCYHAVQLAIRDVLANEQVRIRRNRILVDQPGNSGTNRL